MSMDIHQILKQLPHRYPILLVDRVLEIEKGKRIRALKNVSINEPYFMGHFPHRPVMPGVLMLEAMAQAAALLAFDAMDASPNDQTVYYFAGIDGARFKRPVEPGDQLTLDFSRTSAQCAGPVNISYATAVAACYVALKHIFPDVPANSGVLDVVKFVIPPGLVISASRPRPVGGYTETILRMIFGSKPVAFASP